MILAFALRPEMQRRAQEEIDAVTKRERLPTYEDRESLPFLEAIVRETLRWGLVLPLGGFRSTIENDVYEGWFIPAGLPRFFFFYNAVRGLTDNLSRDYSLVECLVSFDSLALFDHLLNMVTGR
jgi:cytochrome P450